MLSYCASLHPASSDPTVSFMQQQGDEDLSSSRDPAASSSIGALANPQASLFAAMGLDPSSMVFANDDGTLGGPGLAAMQQDDGEEEEDDGENQYEDGEGEEEEVESAAGRQRSDFVNEGRARGAPY